MSTELARRTPMTHFRTMLGEECSPLAAESEYRLVSSSFLFLSSASCTPAIDFCSASCRSIAWRNDSLRSTRISQKDTVRMEAAASALKCLSSRRTLPKRSCKCCSPYRCVRIERIDDSPKYSDSPITPTTSPNGSVLSGRPARSEGSRCRCSTCTVPCSMKCSPGDFWFSSTMTWSGGKTIGSSCDMSFTTTSQGSADHKGHFCSTLRLSSIIKFFCSESGSSLNSAICERVTLEVVRYL
mmetsp:Transcript_28269/g.68722  ORF Transcript_28269/g.68722 Transcript_28269/m.68722 type:complete len:241 (+) Transcript_28269:649-1371(+)